MMFDLTGKVALVTGTGRGVGRGIAAALAAQGATVVLNDRDPDSLAETAELIRPLGSAVFMAAFDVSDRPAVEAGIATAEQQAGPIDILVNNAGKGGQHGIGRKPFRDSGPADWDSPLSVDYYGVLHCTRAVVNGMCDRGWGRIVTISSDTGTTVVGVAKGGGFSAYAAAKGAAVSLMRHVAVETAADGVTANSIALGLMTAPVADDERTAMAAGIPVGRMGTPADVGALCVYLASNEASWMTGQTIHLTGGHVTT